MQSIAGVMLLAMVLSVGAQAGSGIGDTGDGAGKRRRPRHERRMERGDHKEEGEKHERRKGGWGAGGEVDLETITLQVPVSGVRARDLADTWGATRSEGRTHEGIDIFAARNTPVLSASSGVILRQGESERGGTVVWIRGDDGLRHYYAHLENFSDHSVGDHVAAGETIGYVGNSGNAQTTSTHPHYGVYTDTGAVNPYPLLTRKKS